MRKFSSTLVPTIAAVLILGLAAEPASALLIKLKRIYIVSFQTNSSGYDAPPQGYYDLAISGEWPDELVGELIHKGRTVARDLDLTTSNCRDGRQRPRGRFEKPARPDAKVARLSITAEVDVPGPRKRHLCDIQIDVPLAGGRPPKHDRPNTGGPGQDTMPAPQGAPGGLTTPPKPPKHDRPNTGGPGQGSFAPPALPNLRVRSAKALGGREATDLAVVVVNTGAGAAAKTALKLIYIKDGVASTASAKVPALAAGQNAVVNIGTGKPLAAADQVTLRVDDPNQVSETDEGDNGFIYSN